MTVTARANTASVHRTNANEIVDFSWNLITRQCDSMRRSITNTRSLQIGMTDMATADFAFVNGTGGIEIVDLSRNLVTRYCNSGNRTITSVRSLQNGSSVDRASAASEHCHKRALYDGSRSFAFNESHVVADCAFRHA
jgi:hypothetical protein